MLTVSRTLAGGLCARNVKRLIAISALFVAVGYVGSAESLAQEPSQLLRQFMDRQEPGQFPGFGIERGGGKPQSEPGNLSSPQPEEVRQMPSPDGRFIAYEGKAKDGYHDTIWLEDSGTGATVDLLGPENQRRPGAGATEILEWLDNDRIAFTWHCGTGCTSLDIVNIKDRFHWYLCTSTWFYLSPDKQYAVGETESQAGDIGGLALIKMEGGHRKWADSDDCKLIFSGTGVCGDKNSDYFKFDHWEPDSRSFTYKVSHCESRIGEEGVWSRSEERVFNLK